jgi:hypothetical protein
MNLVIKSFIEFAVLLVVTIKRIVFRVVNAMKFGGSTTFKRNLTPLYLELKSQPNKKPEEAHKKLRSACCVLAA